MASRLPCEHSANRASEPLGRYFYARCPSREPKLSYQMSQGMKKSWPDRDSNPEPLAYRASILPTELPSHLVVLWHLEILPRFDIWRSNSKPSPHTHIYTGHQMSQGRKKSWPDRDSNPGLFAYRASTLPT